MTFKYYVAIEKITPIKLRTLWYKKYNTAISVSDWPINEPR